MTSLPLSTLGGTFYFPDRLRFASVQDRPRLRQYKLASEFGMC